MKNHVIMQVLNLISIDLGLGVLQQLIHEKHMHTSLQIDYIHQLIFLLGQTIELRYLLANVLEILIMLYANPEVEYHYQ